MRPRAIGHPALCDGVAVRAAPMTADAPDSPVLGRLVRPADYVRVLAAPLRLRSPHFAVHHLEGRPLPPKRPLAKATGRGSPVSGHPPVTGSLSTGLSTGPTPEGGIAVDDLPSSSAGLSVETLAADPAAPGGPQRWLGLVVPKRHAKRAVTRVLVKRQIRAVAADCAAALAPGLWVVRQRSPFDPKQYPSAASDALRAAARAELRALFERAVRGERDASRPRTQGAGGPGRRGGRTGSPPAEGAPCAA